MDAPTTTTGSIPATLDMVDVRLPIPDIQGGELIIDLSICPCDLAVVSLSEMQHAPLIAEAVCGLRHPRHGQIHFQGQDWDSPPDYANARRGRIGSALDDTAWLPHLSLTDNILLPTLYHTRQRRRDILREATRLAQCLGFIGLPMGHPDDYGEADLRRAAFVRAFLGKPDLVILASRTPDFAGHVLGRLLNTMRQARDDGAAVLWFVPEEVRNFNIALPDCRRYHIFHNRLVEETES